MSFRVGLVFLIYFICIDRIGIPVNCQGSRGSISPVLCQSKGTCGECIAAHPRCAWCPDEGATARNSGMSKRCDFYDRLGSCAGRISPTNIPETIRDEPFSNKERLNDAVQLRPQHIKLKLRPHSVHTFDVQFRQAKDYPLDLYFLMDLSRSMGDDKDNLAKLGADLLRTISDLTSNLRIGFGSFVDKKVMPYVNTLPEKLANPCLLPEVCAAPYGFHNDMPLSDNLNQFSRSVKETQISGNLDNPEGGLDALMQVLVCQEAINWRNKSRKIVVLSTDSEFHQAGDGLLGGIIKPNDERCHLASNWEYTESTTQDYPSISQVNRQIKLTKTSIIFAVTDEVLSIYKDLTGLLEGSSYGHLDNNSANVIELVANQYKEITSSVELSHNASDLFVLLFRSSCLENNNLERNNCSGLKVGSTVDFSISITALRCPKDRSEWKQRIQIHPVGLNEDLIVDVELMCECECQMEGNNEPNSPRCSYGNGTFECGICNCNKNRDGRLCECSLQESQEHNGDQACINLNAGDDKPCTGGRGKCICRVCECAPRENPEEKVYGEFCECDNFSCDKHGGKICNGPSSGQCQCGQCQCNPGWKGSGCQCRDTNSTCIGPDMKICSGQGECVCGQCKCNDTYSGNYCEDCATCPKHCDLFKDCLQCHLFQTGKLKNADDTCREGNCPQFDLVEVNTLEDRNELLIDSKVCLQADDSDGCRFRFAYSYPKDGIPIVIAQRTKDCPDGPNVLGIVLGVAGGTVGIGLVILLIWKLFAMIHDKREYARFEEERQKAKWNKDENPLYKPSIQTIVNPTFEGN